MPSGSQWVITRSEARGETIQQKLCAGHFEPERFLLQYATRAVYAIVNIFLTLCGCELRNNKFNSKADLPSNA